ncbi:hypothetical protein K470DRAFT_240355 [Piedraia hortae CBS 480.64]|uniref:AMMECR1 domain-containing protein n=1 Tax=Piedraia hortae CBS 480.64 TaxID=1314780 RepID=A0A6A7C9K1_9PEZI|nr:hypothetical protein K470DRAFT_240355 [Piedraia hortae CBS 480.64]
MATTGHCAYVFECLVSNFQGRKPLSLETVLQLWDEWESRSREASSSSSSSGTSLPDGKSLNESLPNGNVSSPSRDGKYPLFVSYNTHPGKVLRGCLGTFEPQRLEPGLKNFALSSALEDPRFSPITARLLPKLSAHVTLLTNFSEPSKDALDWIVGFHGIRISFTYKGRKMGATYLPYVAKDQGWKQEDAIVSLMHKAGWQGKDWQKTWKDGEGKLTTYQGNQVGLSYDDWHQWREWVAHR